MAFLDRSEVGMQPAVPDVSLGDRAEAYESHLARAQLDGRARLQASPAWRIAKPELIRSRLAAIS